MGFVLPMSLAGSALATNYGNGESVTAAITTDSEILAGNGTKWAKNHSGGDVTANNSVVLTDKDGGTHLFKIVAASGTGTSAVLTLWSYDNSFGTTKFGSNYTYSGSTLESVADGLATEGTGLLSNLSLISYSSASGDDTTITDKKVWIPSYTEVKDGGTWGFSSNMTTAMAQRAIGSNSWLRSPVIGRNGNAYSVDSKGTFGIYSVSKDSLLRPALQILNQITVNYVFSSTTVIPTDGIFTDNSGGEAEKTYTKDSTTAPTFTSTQVAFDGTQIGVTVSDVAENYVAAGLLTEEADATKNDTWVHLNGGTDATSDKGISYMARVKTDGKLDLQNVTLSKDYSLKIFGMKDTNVTELSDGVITGLSVVGTGSEAKIHMKIGTHNDVTYNNGVAVTLTNGAVADAAGTANNNIVVSDAGVLNLNGTTLNGQLTLAGGTVVFAGENTVTNVISVASGKTGALVGGSNTNVSTLTGDISNGGTLSISNIAINGQLTLSGGTVVFAGSNTISNSGSGIVYAVKAESGDNSIAPAATGTNTLTVSASSTDNKAFGISYGDFSVDDSPVAGTGITTISGLGSVSAENAGNQDVYGIFVLNGNAVGDAPTFTVSFVADGGSISAYSPEAISANYGIRIEAVRDSDGAKIATGETEITNLKTITAGLKSDSVSSGAAYGMRIDGGKNTISFVGAGSSITAQSGGANVYGIMYGTPVIAEESGYAVGATAIDGLESITAEGSGSAAYGIYVKNNGEYESVETDPVTFSVDFAIDNANGTIKVYSPTGTNYGIYFDAENLQKSEVTNLKTLEVGFKGESSSSGDAYGIYAKNGMDTVTFTGADSSITVKSDEGTAYGVYLYGSSYATVNKLGSVTAGGLNTVGIYLRSSGDLNISFATDAKGKGLGTITSNGSTSAIGIESAAGSSTVSGLKDINVSASGKKIYFSESSTLNLKDSTISAVNNVTSVNMVNSRSGTLNLVNSSLAGAVIVGMNSKLNVNVDKDSTWQVGTVTKNGSATFKGKVNATNIGGTIDVTTKGVVLDSLTGSEGTETYTFTLPEGVVKDDKILSISSAGFALNSGDTITVTGNLTLNTDESIYLIYNANGSALSLEGVTLNSISGLTITLSEDSKSLLLSNIGVLDVIPTALTGNKIVVATPTTATNDGTVMDACTEEAWRHAYGGYDNSTTDAVTGNTITINGTANLTGNLYGGYSKSGNVTDNIINIEAGTVTGSVYGGKSDNEDATISGNTLNWSGGTITGGTITANTISITGTGATYLGETGTMTADGAVTLGGTLTIGGGTTVSTLTITNGISVATGKTGALIGGSTTNVSTVTGAISNDGELSVSKLNISNAITNTGTLNVAEVTLHANVSGGTLNVAGGLTQYAGTEAIGAVTVIKSGGQVDLTANLLNADTTVESGGELYLATGELLIDEIKGGGTTYLKASPTSSLVGTLTVKKNAKIAGTLNGSDSTIDMTGDSACTTLTIDTLAGTTNLKIDLDMSDTTKVDMLKITTSAAEDTVLNLSGINITKDYVVTGGGTITVPTYVANGITYVTGDGAASGNLTYKINGETKAEGGELQSSIASSNYVYTFTLGNAGQLNYSLTTAPDNIFKNFIEGKLTNVPQTLSVTEDMADATANTFENTTYDELNIYVNDGKKLGSAVGNTVTLADGDTINLNGGTTAAGIIYTSWNVANGGTLNLSGKIDEQGIITNAGTLNLNSTYTSDTAIDNDGTLNVTAANLKADVTNTNGTVNLGSGELNHIIDNGTVVLTADVNTTNAYLQNNTLVDLNEHTLTITGGNLTSDIGSSTKNKGTLVVVADTTVSSHVYTGVTVEKDDNANGNLTVAATGTLSGLIMNNGTLTNNGNISGSLENHGIGINNNKLACMDNKQGATFTNKGTISDVSDTGREQSTIGNLGTFINDATIAGSVSNAKIATFTNNGTIGLAVVNEGTFINTGKTLSTFYNNTYGVVTNTGTLAGAVTNQGTLTSDISKITANITNNGTFNMSGDLTKNVKGKGVTVLQSDIVAATTDDVVISGTLNGNDKTIDMQDNGTAAYTTLTVGKLAGTANLKIDVDLSGKQSDNLDITGTEANDCTLNLVSINVRKDIEVNPTVLANDYEDAVTYVTGNTDGITFKLAGEAGKLEVGTATSDNYVYNFTLGSAGKLNYKVSATDVTFKKFIEGDLGSTVNTLSLNNDMADGSGTMTKDLTINLNGKTLGTSIGNTVAIGTKTMNLDGGTTEGTVYTGWTTEEGGTLNISGLLKLEGAVTGAGILTNTGTMTISADNLGVAVTNTDSTINLGAGKLTKVITDGTLNITDNVTTDADYIQSTTNTVTEGKVLTLKDEGTLSQALTGDIKNIGTLTIIGTVTGKIDNDSILNLNSKYTSDTAIDNSGTLNVTADNLQADVDNEGVVNLGSGELTKTVTGGNVNVTGTVSAGGNNLVNTAVTAVSGGELTLTGGTFVKALTAKDGGTINLTLVDYSQATSYDTTAGGTININGGTITNKFVGGVEQSELNVNLTSGSKLTLLEDGTYRTIAANVFTNGDTTQADSGAVTQAAQNKFNFVAGVLEITDESYTIDYLNTAVDAVHGLQYSGVKSATKVKMTGDLVEGSITTEQASNLGPNVELPTATVEMPKEERNTIIGTETTTEVKVGEIGTITDKHKEGFSANKLDLSANSTGMVVTDDKTVVLGGNGDLGQGNLITVDGEDTKVKVYVGTTEKVAGADTTPGTLGIGIAGSINEKGYKLNADVTVNEGSKVEVNGNTEITGKMTLSQGTLQTAEGATTKVAQDLEVNTTATILGSTQVAGSLKGDNAVIQVGSKDGKGELCVKEISLQGTGILFVDPAWVLGVGVEGASQVVTETTVLDGTYVAGQNSIIAFGTTDADEARELFNKTQLGWSENKVTAAAYVAQPIDVSNGALIVNGGLTSAPAASNAGTVNFAANSLLMVDGTVCRSTAAISGITKDANNQTQLTVDSTSKLYIANGVAGNTYKILAGENGTIVEGSAWLQANISTNATLEVKSVEYDAVNQNYFNVVLEESSYRFEDTVDPQVNYAMRKAGEGQEASEYVLAVLDYEGITGDHSGMVAELNRIADMSEQLGVMHGQFTASNLTEEAVANHLTISNKSKGKEIWAEAIHTKETVGGLGLNVQANKFTAQYNGAVVGADLVKNDKSTLGIALTYLDGKISGIAGKNDSEYYGATLYGRTNLGKDMGVLYDMTYTRGKNDLNFRSTVTSTEITGDQNANSFSLGVRLEKEVKLGASSLTPYLGARWLRLDGGSFTNSLGMSYDSESTNIWIIPVGLSFKASHESQGWKMSFLADGGYQWNKGDRDYENKVSYNGAKNSFNTDFADKDAWYAGVGLEFAKKNLTITLGGKHLKSDNTKQNRWFANVSYSF